MQSHTERRHNNVDTIWIFLRQWSRTIYLLQNTENTCYFPYFQAGVGQCKAVIRSYAWPYGIIGWDSEWGKLKTVSAEGSKTTGTKRPFGLDCSGFVTWSFINSGYNASAIGHGTKGQIAKCSRISWSSAQAGDLAFYGDLSHVGIVAGKDAAGNILVIHCSSGRNNVVITTNSGFGFAARPNAY